MLTVEGLTALLVYEDIARVPGGARALGVESESELRDQPYGSREGRPTV